MSTYLYRFIAILLLVISLFSCSSTMASDFTIYDIKDKEINLSDFEDVAIVVWNSR